MASTEMQQETISGRLIGRWEAIGQKLAALAEEFPEDKFEYKPVEGVRTIGGVFRHVAFWNRYVANTARGKKADSESNGLPKAEFASKGRILDALKQSTEDASNTLREHKDGLDPEMAEMLVTFIEHNCEHYGQLAVYARLNGIVPPASRG